MIERKTSVAYNRVMKLSRYPDSILYDKNDYPNEVWKRMPGFGNRQISSWGRAKGLNGKILKLRGHQKNKTNENFGQLFYEIRTEERKLVRFHMETLFLMGFPDLIYGDSIMNYKNEVWHQMEKPYTMYDISSYGRVRITKSNTFKVRQSQKYDLENSVYPHSIRLINDETHVQTAVTVMDKVMKFFPNEYAEIMAEYAEETERRIEEDDTYYEFPNEVWKPVKGTGNKTWISNYARIISFNAGSRNLYRGLMPRFINKKNTGSLDIAYDKEDKERYEKETGEVLKKWVRRSTLYKQHFESDYDYEALTLQQIFDKLVGGEITVQPIIYQRSIKSQRRHKAYSVYDIYTFEESYFDTIEEMSRVLKMSETTILKVLNNEINHFKNKKIYYNNAKRGVKDAGKHR